MPTFHVTSPDGSVYEVNAPEGATEDQAIAYAQQQHQADQPSAATAPAQPASNTPPVFDKTSGAAANFAQGALLGGGDEAIAGAAALMRATDPDGHFSDLSKYYDEALPVTRQGMTQFSNDHPGIAAVSGLAGGAATIIPAVMMGGAPVEGASLLSKMGAAAKTGAAIGGVSGFNSGEGGFANRAINAGKDAALYAGLSAAAPVAIAGVSNVGGKLWDAGKVAGSAVGNLVTDWVNPEKAALSRVGQAIANDAVPVNGQAQMPVQDLIDAIKQRGLSPAEAGGSNVEAMTDALAQKPGPARPFIQQMMDQRVADQRAKLTGLVQDTLGSDGQGTNAIQMAQDAKAKIAPLAEAAFGTTPQELPEDAYIYHGTPAKNIDSILQNGLKPSTRGMEGAGTYFGRTPDSIYNYVDDDAAVLRANKQAMIDKYGAYHTDTNRAGKLYGTNSVGEDLLLDKSAGNVPPSMLELKTDQGWVPLTGEAPNNFNPVGADPTIQRLLQNRDVTAGIPRGIRIIRNEADAAGTPFNLQDYGLVETNPGVEDTLAMKGVPNMRLIDAAKRGLDAQINENSNEWGHLNDLGRSQFLLKKALVDKAKELNPAYAEYLNTAADQYALQDAAKLGRGIWNSPNKEETITRLSELSAPQKKVALDGAVRSLTEQIEKRPDQANLAFTKLARPYYRDLLSPLVDDPQSLDNLVTQLQQHADAFRRNSTWLAQSRTALRGEFSKDGPTTFGSVLNAAQDKLLNSNAVRDRASQILLDRNPETAAQNVQRALQLAPQVQPTNFITNPAPTTKALDYRKLLSFFYPGAGNSSQGN